MGGSATIKVDVRVIAATNKNLPKEIEANSFREDLYYRLNVVPIEMPSLRKRKEDIGELVNHFLVVFKSKSIRALGKFLDKMILNHNGSTQKDFHGF